MRIKSNKVISSSLFTPCDPISPEDVKENQFQIKHDISSSREYLESLRTKIYKTVDASGSNASIYRLDGVHDYEGVDYTIQPSIFLSKAYTTETFDEQGEGIENRDQPYIKAGKNFSDYCRDHADTLEPKVALFDDVGKIIAAINAALSMLNKIEANLIKAEADPQEYEYAGVLLPLVPMYINLVLQEAKESKIIKVIPEQTMVQQILSSLSDMIRSLKKFLSHLGKSEDDIYKNRFEKIEEKYESPNKQDPNKPEPK